MRGVEQIPWLYDGFMHVMEPLGLGHWRHVLLRGAEGRILEVGCGTGRNLPLYRDAARLTALDPELDVLLTARSRAPEVPLVVARAEALPFRTESFDTVVSSLVFCSVGEPRTGLGEIAHVLRPGGRLRMMEHVRHGNRFLGWLQDVVQPFWTWMTGGCRPNRDTEKEVLGAGFSIAPESRRASGAMRLFSAVWTG